MILGLDTEAMAMPMRRGPERARLLTCVPLVVKKVHSRRSPWQHKKIHNVSKTHRKHSHGKEGERKGQFLPGEWAVPTC